ncbi:hypothetical protein ACFX4N_23465 [Priestia sp. YIM B13551]|uniref:hypothetical protein n=1 Tax=Priestia sp. YIM B13551 TaxID=3366306 RepID=UPI00366DD4D6
MTKSILWCTGHYTNEFCKLKAEEIRQKIKDDDEEFQDYSGVRIVDKVMDYDTNNNVERQFNRIRLILK